MSQKITIVNCANLSLSECSPVSIYHSCVQLALIKLRSNQYWHRMIDITTRTRVAREKLKLTPKSSIGDTVLGISR